MFTTEKWNRINFEEALVNKEFPGFWKFHNSSEFGFTGMVTPESGTASYELRVNATDDYPYSKPALYVVQPRVLWLRGCKKSINSLEITHDYHTYSNGPNGCVQICHTSGWAPSMSINQVLVKGVIWLEAYSMHLRSGDTIAKIIDSFEKYFRIWTSS